MASAAALKDQGNKAFAAKDYDQAIQLFTQAIELDPQNHVLFSNRSAAKAGKRHWVEALEDAEKVVVILLLCCLLGPVLTAVDRGIVYLHKSFVGKGLRAQGCCTPWRAAL